MKVRHVSQVVFKSTNYETSRSENDEELVLRSVYYPMPSYGNNVTTYIKLDKKNRVVRIFNVRMNWNGTGRDDIAYLELNADEFNKLLETARNVKNQEDFDKMIEVIKEIEKRVEDEYSKRIDELIDELINVSTVQEKLRSLKNEEVLKELKEYLIEKVEDFLDP
jgi:predicted house-cleaning noncanonical NTP pyrophosphatase (MazG superfamily)